MRQSVTGTVAGELEALRFRWLCSLTKKKVHAAQKKILAGWSPFTGPIFWAVLPLVGDERCQMDHAVVPDVGQVVERRVLGPLEGVEQQPFTEREVLRSSVTVFAA